MAFTFQSHVVSDLCLGKPSLKSISLSSSLSDALAALKSSHDTFLTVWSCYHRRLHSPKCRCVGRISMVDILSFLCKQSNSASPVSALQSPVSEALSKNSGKLVKHVDPSTSLLEAIGLIVEGAQNLIVPIQTNNNTCSPRKKAAVAASNQEYCWLTQEDLLRFILNRIGLFTPTAACSLEHLGVIRTDISAVDYQSSASVALDLLASPLTGQTPVAVVEDGALVGEISSAALAGTDESAAAAIMALSCGDLMAYVDSWGGPPEYLVAAVKSRLKETGSDGLLALLDDDYLSCAFSYTTSSDDDDTVSMSSSSSSMLSRRHSRSGSYSGTRAEEITCHPGSSLVAVMFQAIAHRASYMWVVDEGFGLVGIVTFSDMLEVIYEHMKCMFEGEELE